MTRRRFRPSVLAVGCAGMILIVGCDPLHRQHVRSATDELMAEPPSEAAVSAPTEAKGFFKQNRSAGGWSSEAREIEKDLGAN